MNDPGFPEERVVREERLVERQPVTARRRITVERGAGPGLGMNPVGAIIAAVLVVFILVLIFGFLV